MELKQRKRQDPRLQYQSPASELGEGDDAPSDQPAGRPERTVYCEHSIHDGYFSVAGLTVREARRMLAPLLNISDEAVAVIDGEVVDEDRVIEEGVGVLSFVKKSSIKG